MGAPLSEGLTGAGAATMNPWLLGGGLLLDFASGIFGESPSDAAKAAVNAKYNWTAPGAREMYSLIKPMYESMLKGGEAPDMGLLNKYYDMARSSLVDQQRRSLGEATSMGMAQGSQMNLSNPYTYANFMGRRATTGFADQFKDLEASGMQTKFGAQRSLLNQLLGLAPSLIEMGAGRDIEGENAQHMNTMSNVGMATALGKNYSTYNYLRNRG